MKKNTHFKLEHSNSDWNWKKTCNRTFCSSKLNFLWNERHQEFQSQSAMSTRCCWKLDFHLMKSCECVCVCVYTCISVSNQRAYTKFVLVSIYISIFVFLLLSKPFVFFCVRNGFGYFETSNLNGAEKKKDEKKGKKRSRTELLNGAKSP